MKISIICATIGPLSEVDSLICSLISALERADSAITAECVLVDQSDAPGEHVFPASHRLALIHIRNPRRGLSLNRNIALEAASGQWIMLMDSDCCVSEDYFIHFMRLIEHHPEVSLFAGKILEPDYNSPLFRNWPREDQKLSTAMMWYFATSVNTIFKSGNDNLRFDENFGLGARYGSCEDLDFFLRLERSRHYSPDLKVFHPDIFRQTLPRLRLDSYSFGFGALCAKHAYPLGVIMLFSSFIKKLLAMLRGKANLTDLTHAMAFRLKGFVDYLAHKRRSKHA
jgi:GT2 family glycosyltransferase